MKLFKMQNKRCTDALSEINTYMGQTGRKYITMEASLMIDLG